MNFTHELTDLLNKTATSGKVFQENNDKDRYEKIMLFGEKLVKEEYVIGFAGHFSAGKSSMINALTGVDLLPASPIPTSANIVKLQKSALDYAIIHLSDGKALKYEGHGFSDAVKSFSKNGADVSLVEIGHEKSALPEGITVMDTPGVDSTDDTHRLSTESALHLADLVFYTMDYNHVQSELNFSFTKELLRFNPNVYLIINQIDKHIESQLSFNEFKQSVEESFKLWGVEPKAIFYTSLVDLEHPNNDFNEVKRIVDGSMENWRNSFIHNAYKTLHNLQNEHKQFLNETITELVESHSDFIVNGEWTQHDQLINEIDEAKKTLALFTEDTFSNTFDKERTKLVQNAAITPYETRELLKGYLESLSSRFKVGFLSSAKKTEAERIRRKNALAENIQKLIHTQIEVHLKTLMKKSLQDANMLNDKRSLSIDSINMTIPFTEIEKRFNALDVITGDAVLNYSNQMKSNITEAFRKLTDDWKTEMAQNIKTSGNKTTEILQEKILLFNRKIHIIEKVEKLKLRLKNFTLEIENPAEEIIKSREALIQKWSHKEIIDITEYVEIEEEATNQQFEVEKTPIYSESLSTKDVSKRAHQVAKVVSDIPGFMETADYLRKKANRLDKQDFTVALFGAFSAGKSSFCNALIGENILPVSPNPTTATINRIRPVSTEKKSGTAEIVLKTVDRMTEDVIRSFDALEIPVDTLDEAYERTNDALAAKLLDERLQIHKAFISAFKLGYPVYKNALGTVIKTNRNEFVKFVAEEDRSCFVESIDFYYDCELTRKGITLVDTPGADSINARHTDVAFDYIRNADAILFVTYYNHAFARTDREFLIQLGRVKDIFELDKMFFIVNAIDLAANEEETNLVKSFVGNELKKFGIRNPRVHGVSSLQALKAKNENRLDPFLAPFEKEFHHFLESDLNHLAVQSLKEETSKTTERLASLISRTEINIKRKSDRLAELGQLEESIRVKYGQSIVEVFQTSAKNEVNELVYYIVQRVFLRFSDFFREGYNPSIFRNKSANQALKNALDETVNMLGFDLTQELKVTNLRMLNFITKQLTNRQRAEINSLKEIDEILSPILFEPNEAQMLTFSSPFPDSSVYSSLNKSFRNERSFFEKGDRDKLKEKLEELLKNDTVVYLEKEKERIEKWISQWLEKEAEALREHLLTECLTQIDSEKTLLEGTEKLEYWREKYDSLLLKELS